MSARKKGFSTQIPEELHDRLRATVAGLQSAVSPRITLSECVGAALSEWITRMENEYADGNPFPPLADGLLVGARLGGRASDAAASPESGEG